MAGKAGPKIKKRPKQNLAAFFSRSEIEKIEAARTSIDPDRATIAYCVYENPFARSGGIYAVAVHYSSELAARGKDVVVLSPYHHGLKTAPTKSELRKVGKCSVPFGGRKHAVRLYEHLQDGVRWILFGADAFFDAAGGDGRTDPYIHTDPDGLLRDSLFASKAVPYVLGELGLTENVILHLQDWELASASLTVKEAVLDGVLDSAATVLTSHNPYDHPLNAATLGLVTGRKYRGKSTAGTVYQYMVPLCDASITTVSGTFAAELSTDPVQTEHFADHLQEVFDKQGVVGVANGLFGKLHPPYPEELIESLQAGDPQPILKAKQEQRREMLDVLVNWRDERILGHLEMPADAEPVFMMFGRLDPGQKGFDVLIRAIESLPEGFGRFILTPIFAGAPDVFRKDFARIAKARPGEVVVYPFRMEKGYMEAMQGATYAVMPSLYEPFGGATEPYLAGTPVIARGTGGLIEQVVSIDADPDNATGIVYREAPAASPGEWSNLERSPTPEGRTRFPVYRAMVETLAAALARGAEIYRSEPERYARMLANLHGRAGRFTWKMAMDGYYRVYGTATSR